MKTSPKTEEWYINRRIVCNRARAKSIAEMHEYVNALKIQSGCNLCGYNAYPAALEFHHREPESKLFPIAWAISKCVAKAAILLEIEKCDVLCSNCHRVLTFKEKQHEQRKQSDTGGTTGERAGSKIHANWLRRRKLLNRHR
jgi:hypothetical protein